ncbi:MAG: hypothetical protein NZ772_06535 [Cyanobacteria bacterium]|nr:hypothetical protein [Cyanobacteriota bacterium]MDW8201157.1 hypothetical protein [Cyanobacteriota bacterium SKYGB_h_bin112]
MTTRYCRDQARDELLLMLGGGAAAGLAGEIPVFGTQAFNVSITAVQGLIVSRIAAIYGMEILAAGGAGALAGTIMAAGGANLLLLAAWQLGRYLPPGLRQIARPSVSAAAAWVFGEAAIAYFESRYPNRVYTQPAS